MDEENIEVRDDRKWHFTIIENAIFENEKITYRGILAYNALCYHVNRRDGTCYPKIKTLAKTVGVSESTMKRGLIEIRDGGIVEIHYRKDPDNPKRNMSNLYIIKGVGSHRTQGGVTENPGVGSQRTANYIHTELEPLNEKVEVGRALPDLCALKLFSEENPVFKNIKDKDWRAILRAAEKSENDLRDVLIYVLQQFDRGKPIENVGGYVHRCLEENWSIDFEDGDPWYAYFAEHDTSWKDGG